MNKILSICFLVFMMMFAGFATAAVNINTATVSELDTVKGIGPAKAKAIIDYREKHGPFQSVDDLRKVKGFGAKTLDKLRPDLTVGESAAPVQKPAAPAAPVQKPTAPAAPVPPPAQVHPSTTAPAAPPSAPSAPAPKK